MRIKVKNASRYDKRYPELKGMTPEQKKQWDIERIKKRFK